MYLFLVTCVHGYIPISFPLIAQHVLQGCDLVVTQAVGELYLEVDVHVSKLIRPSMFRHAFILYALPGVWLDDFPRVANNLERAPIQVLDAEGGPT